MIVVQGTADGTVSANYEYGPFGELIRSTGPMAQANPFRFSTKYDDDESDLLYYGHRYYKPSSGTWVSRDPLGESGFELMRHPHPIIRNPESLSHCPLCEARASSSAPTVAGGNLYSLVANNPENGVDPLGLSQLECCMWPFGKSDKEKEEEVVKTALDIADAIIAGKAPVAGELDPVLRTICDPCLVLDGAAGILQEQETKCELDNNFGIGGTGPDPCQRFTDAKNIVTGKAKDLHCHGEK